MATQNKRHLTFESKKPLEKKTTFFEKYSNYIEYLLENPDFNFEIKNIRKKYHITNKRFKKIKEIDDSDESFYTELLKTTDINDDTEAIIKKYGLNNSWRTNILKHIMFNHMDMEELYRSTFSVIDMNPIYESLASGKPEMVDLGLKLLKLYVGKNPIAIMINPYAGENDIKSYLNAFYKKSIEPKQIALRKNGVKLGKIRGKNERVKLRDDFIFQNKDLPIKELQAKVYEKFSQKMEYFYLIKIKNKEIRKRMRPDNI